MKRLSRWLLKGLAAVSLLACLATLALWARSLRHADVASWTHGNSLIGGASVDGRLVFSWDTNYPAKPGFWFNTTDSDPPSHVPALRSQWGGFGTTDESKSVGATSAQFRVMMLPHWFGILVSAILALSSYLLARSRNPGKARG
jgi:hypothetical protein